MGVILNVVWKCCLICLVLSCRWVMLDILSRFVIVNFWFFILYRLICILIFFFILFGVCSNIGFILVWLVWEWKNVFCFEIFVKLILGGIKLLILWLINCFLVVLNMFFEFWLVIIILLFFDIISIGFGVVFSSFCFDVSWFIFLWEI